MTENDINDICWWIPFRKLRKAVRATLKAVKMSSETTNNLSSYLSAINNYDKIKDSLIDNNIPFVSSIVIAHNLGERYLRACLDSLINQTLKNIEIIIINDASEIEEDDRICLEYASKDSRIKYIKLEQNRGPNYARSYGLSLSNGYSIHFVDGDDYLMFNAYDVLFHQMISSNVNIVSFGFVRFDDNLENSHFTYENHFQRVPFLMYDDDIFKSIVFDYVNPSMCCKFYNHNFLKNIENEIFDEKENLALCEDLCANIKILYHAKSMINLNINFYYYRNRASSTLNNITDNLLLGFKKVYFSIFDYFEKNNLDIDYRYIFESLSIHIKPRYNLVKNDSKYSKMLTDVLKEIINKYSNKVDKKTIDEIFINGNKGNTNFIKWYKKIY